MLGRINLRGEAVNLDFTFESGQIFQWRKVDDWWLGALEDRAMMLKVEGGSLLFRSEGGLGTEALTAFLGLGAGQATNRKGDLDDFSSSLLREYEGLRVLRQDPWTCLVSYMISASLSIKAIDKILDRIAAHSKALSVDGNLVKGFPHPSEFLGLGRPQRDYLGKKWVYLKMAAKDVRMGFLDFDSLRRAQYEDAWRSLVVAKDGHVLGIGPKVADCVLLFSLDKHEAFPMDRWIMRGLSRYYDWLLSDETAARLKVGKESLTAKEYAEVSKSIRKHFGEVGGLVQECLFLRMRTAEPRRPLV